MDCFESTPHNSQYSVEIPVSKRPGHSFININPDSKAHLHSDSFAGRTLYESFQYSPTHYPNRPYLGTRVKTEQGFGPYEWITYNQVS